MSIVYRILKVLIAIGILSHIVWAADRPRRVLMVINEGFWAPEYFEPRKIFDQAGYQVKIAARHPGPVHPDERNTDFAPVKADLGYDQVDLSQFDAVTFAGGNGAWTDYFPNDTVHKLVTDALRRDSLVTAFLCSSTGLLGVAGNFDGQSKPIAAGRHVTGYYRVEGLLRNLGKVNYDPGEKGKPYVVVDGKLITGRDPASAELFAQTVVGELHRRK